MKPELMRAAIVEIHKRGDYPTAGRINKIVGRKGHFFNGRDAQMRREIFSELNITLRWGPHTAPDARNVRIIESGREAPLQEVESV